MTATAVDDRGNTFDLDVGRSLIGMRLRSVRIFAVASELKDPVVLAWWSELLARRADPLEPVVVEIA